MAEVCFGEGRTSLWACFETMVVLWFDLAMTLSHQFLSEFYNFYQNNREQNWSRHFNIDTVRMASDTFPQNF